MNLFHQISVADDAIPLAAEVSHPQNTSSLHAGSCSVRMWLLGRSSGH